MGVKEKWDTVSLAGTSLLYRGSIWQTYNSDLCGYFTKLTYISNLRDLILVWFDKG